MMVAFNKAYNYIIVLLTTLCSVYPETLSSIICWQQLHWENTLIIYKDISL